MIRSFTMLTTTANDALHPLHQRIPVAWNGTNWLLWLIEAEGDIAALLRPSHRDPDVVGFHHREHRPE